MILAYVRDKHSQTLVEVIKTDFMREGKELSFIRFVQLWYFKGGIKERHGGQAETQGESVK